MAQDKTKIVTEIEWTAENEVHLSYALLGHKPVGVCRYFQMICILENFCNSVSKDIPSNVLWDHLNTMYDMDALHDNEDLPFPNDEVDFTIEGNVEFESLMNEKLQSNGNASSPVKEEKTKSDDTNTSTVTPAKTAPVKTPENKTTSKGRGLEDKSSKTENKSESSRHEKSEDVDKPAKTGKKRSAKNTDTPTSSKGTSTKKRRMT